MFDRITPRAAHRIGLRTMAVAGPLAMATLLAWGLRWDIAGLRPQLTLMLYMLLLLLAVGGFMVAMLAACHLQIAKAFSAGFQTGQVAAAEPDPFARAEAAAKRGETDPVLRLVD